MTREELQKKTISAISLGCDKNRVDLEHMLFVLKEYGFNIVQDVEEANIVIINTCAFIEPAILEAIENIEYVLSLKRQGKVEKIIVSGCLPMRCKKEIEVEFPEIDAFITLQENKNITQILETIYDVPKNKFVCKNIGRIITHGSKYAYLKIAEGCSNGCAYCTIPRIRGRFTSVPLDELVTEAKTLAQMGYKELILVAQDTARYGEDLPGNVNIITLLKELIKIKDIEWIRLQYIYPEWLSDELLDFIYNNEKICKYIDMPLQHIDDRILKEMNRKTGEEKSRAIVKKIKDNYPLITLRTTFIVGLPTETKKDFKKLCDFITEAKIPYASFFSYYREDKTKAYYMKQVPNFIKKRRLKKIEKLQNVVLNEYCLSKIGQECLAMIDSFDYETNIFYGHLQSTSPDVDLAVLIEKPQNVNLEIGKIYKIKITQASACGFKGEII